MVTRIFACVFCLLFSSLSFAADEPTATPPLKKVGLGDFSTGEIALYQSGEIGTGSLIAGGLLGTVVGLGTGHIVYGKYTTKGWIFTVGELGSMAVMMAGATTAVSGCISGNDSCGSGLGAYMLGAVGLLGFRIWEIIDVWTLPASHNAEYRAVKARMDLTDARPRFHLAPNLVSSSDGKVHPGLQLGFRW